MKKAVFLVFTVVFSLFLFKTADAAQFLFSPNSGDLVTGQSFDVSVKIKTEGDETLNAAQGKFTFDKTRLEVVSTSKENSVFNFWLQDPTYSNENGTIEFTGGVAGGLSGAALQVVKISFKTKAEGSADLIFSQDESAIAANDGQGTNILTLVTGATFKIAAAPKPTPEKPTPTPPPPPAEQVPAPILIERPVIKAVKLPGMPDLSVTLYPDPANWYSQVAPFLVKWQLPPEIIAVATGINKNPAFEPTQSEGLFDAKVFPPLSEGVNYLHVQFKNTQGWGGIAHYQLAVDTMPPLPFEVSVVEGTSTDNPQPTLIFKTGDQLSGIDYYQIKIPNKDPIVTKENTYKLPLLAPGKYRISVKAYDKAENSAEAITELNILPIASPEILYIDKELFIGTGSLAIRGKTLPNAKIILEVVRPTGERIFGDVTLAGDEGYWQAVLTPSLQKGDYYVEVLAQNERGALSLPVKSSFFRVKDKPAFKLGALEVTPVMLLVSIISILILGIGGYYLLLKRERARISRRITVAERDAAAIFGTILEDLEKCVRAFDDKKVTDREATELEMYLKRMEEYIKKARRYITEGLEEIND